MKRTLALILAAVMILAAVPALGDEPDPIVGVWYTYFQIESSMMGAFYIFDANGSITMIALMVGAEGYDDSSLLDISAGSWLKITDGGAYNISSNMKIDGPAYLNGDCLYLLAGDGDAMLYRRLTNYDGPQLVFKTKDVLNMMIQQ